MLPQKGKENLKDENRDKNFCVPDTLINVEEQVNVVAN